MNNLRQIIKIIKQLRTSCQLVLVLFLLLSFALFNCFLARLHREIKNQVRNKQSLSQQQQAWMAKQSEIQDKLEEIVSKIKSQNQNQDLSLLVDIEEIASHLNCKYELSNEIQSVIDNVVLSGVWLNLSDLDISAFVQFCDAIEEKKLNLSEVCIRALKGDRLNVKCLIESISLMKR